MEYTKYLTSIITNFKPYTLDKSEQKTIKLEGIKKYIYNKLNSSKFRSSKIDDFYDLKVKEKIDLTVNHERPLHLLFPFGGIKNPNIESFPHINFAEVFSLIFLRDYLLPITSAYKPGVILEFWSVAVFQNKVNKISVEYTDIYHNEFSELINNFKIFLPENLKIIYTRVEDEIPRKVIEKQLDIKVKELKKIWNNQPKETIEQKLKKARRNIHIDSVKDTNFIERLVLESALYHDAFVSECWAYNYLKWEYKPIMTLGYYGTEGWAIRIRSSKKSTVHFWSGIGLISNRNAKPNLEIYSATQFNAIRDTLNIESIKLKNFTNLPLNKICIFNK